MTAGTATLPLLMNRLRIDLAVMGSLCARHRIHRLSLFGSVLRDDFRDDSDIDVLVEFESGQTPGLDFFAIQDELSALVGREVDLNTPGFLDSSFRERVQREAVPIYESRR